MIWSAPVNASWSVFARDAGRLLRTPKVWVIVIGVLFTPALYAWVNVAAFWDPYGNTGNIQVAVVNEDEGGDSDFTGELDVGAQVVDQLKANDQLGWQFMDAEEADDSLRKGDVYASITVPETFTSDILSMFQGTYSEPTLLYRVNEKDSAVSPKITDQGATTLDTTVNSVFKEMVAEAVTTELSSAGGDLEKSLTDAQEGAADAFDETAQTMAAARGSLSRIQNSLGGAGSTISAAQDTLGSVDTALADAVSALDQVRDIMSDVQEQVSTFTGDATDSYLGINRALTDATSGADAAVAAVTGELDRAGAAIGNAGRDASGALAQSERVISQLENLLGGAAMTPGAAQPLQDALSDLRERSEADRALVDRLGALGTDATDAASTVSAAADAFGTATDETRNAARALQTSVSDALPGLNSAIDSVNSTAGRFSGALESTRTLLQESSGLLDGVDDGLDRVDGVIDSFDGNLSGIESGLRTAKTDILALNVASDGSLLDSVTDLDSVSISRFLSTPAEVESNAVYPVDSYGSGMASLFTNLSLWIGAFMLMVIFRTEVDRAGMRRLTVGQAYRGRLWLLGALSVVQSVVVTVGDLVLGVQNVNPFAFTGTGVLTGLAYLTIIYALVSALGHIGRGIALALAFIQIPGATGLYPIEMMPDFFQSISPFLPLTHGITALRETVGGFYGDHWWRAMGVLALMALVAFVAGMLVRRWLSNVNRQVNDQLEEGGLIISEKVEITGSGYKLSDTVGALRDREGFRDEIDRRWRRLRENYALWLGLSVIVGVLGVMVLGVLARVIPDQKTLFFGLLCLWFLLVIGFIAALDYIRQSYRNAHEVSEMSEDELQLAVADKGEQA